MNPGFLSKTELQFIFSEPEDMITDRFRWAIIKSPVA